MTDHATKQAIQDALHAFNASTNLRTSAISLFAALGYHSDKTLELEPNTAQELQDFFGIELAAHRALHGEWLSVDVLFQVTDDEMRSAGQQQMLPFASNVQMDNARIESYMFFAIRLRGDSYTRTQLATITREVNKHFPMPILILFQHGPTLTISIINRRLHKREPGKDVLEKVTLIKDIQAMQPHRAHIDILYDLSLPALAMEHPVGNFVELQRAWAYVLSSSELNKRFYREIANWYFWATQHVTFPAGAEADEAKRNDIGIIRLITRLIFVWFLKEKGLVPADLFNERKLQALLVDLSSNASSYYKAIVQNLFFATLNQEMGKREFRKKSAQSGGRDQNRLVTNLYRYQDYFQAGGDEQMLALMRDIPFLNGGLFECLDTEDDTGKVIRIDGFSEEKKNPLSVPNMLFFSDEQAVDLHRFYGTSGRAHTVRGLIHILNRYKFTVAENTPIEEEIALDPELLGQVFENLLAAYNPETGATARKQTGSFYTPREIVNYMVDESLIAYLETALAEQGSNGTDDLQARLRHLLAYNDEAPQFDDDERQRLIQAIDSAKILDPACGSGAFPIGVLQKLVFLLGKLDPGNQRWKQRQIDNVERDIQTADAIDDEQVRENALESLAQKRQDIERAFAYDALDYARKLYLIQNCIYGVDIQPIAVQIAKLRCFIALIVDQHTDESLENRGILALPNLETRFVAANTLLGAGVSQGMLRSQQVLKLEAELAIVRQRHFEARTPRTKRKYRAEDERIRQQIGVELKRDGVPGATADMLARWDPYDQNATADFFNPMWMFSLDGGFDIVLGNPPYVRQEQIKALKPAFKDRYTCYVGTADLYVYFYERGIELLKPAGILTFISSNKYFRSGYGKKLRHYLGSKTTIHQLIDFGDAPIFTAIAYPSIIITRNATPDSAQTRALTWEPGQPTAEFASVFHESSFLIAQKELGADGWRLEVPAVLRLMDKLRKAGTPLGEYVQGRFYYGIKTGLNEAFVVDRATRDWLIAEHPSSEELLKPYLRGRDVKRWQAAFSDHYLIRIESSENKKHPWSGKPEQQAEQIFAKTYPAIHRWFEQYRERLINRYDQGHYFWELRSCTYWQEFEQSKIVYPDIYEHQSFTVDTEGFYFGNTCYFIPIAENWICGLLNSQTVEWFYSLLSNKVRGGYMRAFSDYMKQIPIPAATKQQQRDIGNLVDRILAAKRANAGADVSALEAEIDAHVYRLYGLTAEEIAVVEGEK